MPATLIYNIRMLEVMRILIMSGQVPSQAGFCRVMGEERYMLTKIKAGVMSFTVAQIDIIMDEFHINANFIFGFSEKVFRGNGNTPQVENMLSEIRSRATRHAT